MKLEKIDENSPGYPSLSDHRTKRRGLLKMLFGGLVATFVAGCSSRPRVYGEMAVPTEPGGNEPDTNPGIRGKMVAPKTPPRSKGAVKAPVKKDPPVIRGEVMAPSAPKHPQIAGRIAAPKQPNRPPVAGGIKAPKQPPRVERPQIEGDMVAPAPPK